MLAPSELSKTKAKPVSDMRDIRSDVRMMLDLLDKGIMYDGQRRGGVALNHAQVSKDPFDFFVIDRRYKEFFNDRRTLINVKILDQHDLVDFEEGCLSFPANTSMKTKRFRFITVEMQYPDWHGDLHWPVKQDFEGLPAIIIQHEMDHAQGENIFEKFRV